MKNQVKEITVDIFNAFIKVNTNGHGIFRHLITIKVNGENKPVLIIGHANSEIGDGHCITILNPEKSLLDKVYVDCCYLGDLLKNVVRGRCDLMLELNIDTYKAIDVSEVSSYKAKVHQPARFVV